MRRSGKRNGERSARHRLRSGRPSAQASDVHPLLSLTLLGPLMTLFGLVGQMVHRGRAPSEAERAAGGGIAGLKRMIAAREWGAALPALLITGGLLWMMTFGALAIAIAFNQRVTGLLMMSAPLWMLARIVRDYRRG
jgi:hypothetical protein